MVRGKLVTGLILREECQNGKFIDPVDGVEHEVKVTTWIGGRTHGAPIVEIDGHYVTWDTTELIDEAVEILREEGHLPKEKKEDGVGNTEGGTTNGTTNEKTG